MVRFGRSWFAVTAVDGTGLFDPAAHGIPAHWIGTACWRGYIVRYAVAAGRLVVRDLEVGAPEAPPPLDGVRPRWHDGHDAWHYPNLDVAAEFSGRLLLGRGDFADRPYLNMGFRPAWMYADVRELSFRDGRLLSAADRSAGLPAVRAVASAGPEPGEPVGDWADRTFSLGFAYSWPLPR